MELYATISLDDKQVKLAIAQYVDAIRGLKVEPDKVCIVPAGIGVGVIARVDISGHVTIVGDGVRV